MCDGGWGEDLTEYSLEAEISNRLCESEKEKNSEHLCDITVWRVLLREELGGYGLTPVLGQAPSVGKGSGSCDKAEKGLSAPKESSAYDMEAKWIQGLTINA